MLRPPTGRLRTRLLVGTLVPTVLALAAFGFLAQAVAERMLEDELGRRLAVAAAGTAALILPEQVDALADGDTASLTYANVGRKLALARQRFDVRRVAVVTRGLIGRVDTAGLIAPGTEAHELGADRLELDRAASGHPTASPLFVGHDGVAYKRGYAAIGGAGTPGAEGGVTGFAVVEASADYFVPLASLRRRLVVAGAIALGLMLVVTMASARRISRPVVALTDAAAPDRPRRSVRAGGGDDARRDRLSGPHARRYAGRPEGARRAHADDAGRHRARGAQPSWRARAIRRVAARSARRSTRAPGRGEAHRARAGVPARGGERLPGVRPAPGAGAQRLRCRRRAGRRARPDRRRRFRRARRGGRRRGPAPRERMDRPPRCST